MHGEATMPDVIDDARVDELIAAGRADEAIEVLVGLIGGSEQPDPAIEALLVRARHRVAVERCVRGGAPRPSSREASDGTATHTFPAGRIPEVDRAGLTAELLDAALSQRGALLVRGLVDAGTAEELLESSERAVEGCRRFVDGEPAEATSPWFVPFEAAEGFDFGPIVRKFTADIGGCLTVEAPRVLNRLLHVVGASGLREVLADYFGDAPLVSARKSTIRHASPDSPSEWHQDGAFLGAERSTVNLWLALTPCGTDAPGVDVFPDAFDRLVPTGTAGALFDWSIGNSVALGAGTELQTPQFSPGDALLFNQLTLHRTSVRPSMTAERYALESWFFVPSDFPYEQVPIEI